jgi:hypothetical protein
MLTAQGGINSNLESHLRSGVVIVQDDSNKGYDWMEIWELPASIAGSHNQNFVRNILVRLLDLEDLIA